MSETGDASIGLIPFRSSNPFEFGHILRRLEEAPPQKMFGWLLVPEEPRAPMPAVVACHGSMGWRGHHHEHMVRALEAGIAVFRIHSFDARQVQSVVEDQMSVTAAMLLTDAYRALQMLARHPMVDATRIGITGWSLGGTVSLYAAYEPLREALVGADGPRFAAHLPIYPAAHVSPETPRWSPAPIRVLHGEADDYTPVSFVRGLVPAITRGGGTIEILTYPDAHHSFDSIEPLTFLPSAIRLGKRSITLAEDGAMYFTASDGTRHPIGEPSQRKESFERSNTKGAHIGGSWSARRRVFDDALDFWRTSLLG